MNPLTTKAPPYLWRGSLLPLGCAAAPNPATPIHPDTPHAQVLRLLRSRTGASSLATKCSPAARPVVRGFIPAGLRSSPKTCDPNSSRYTACTGFTAAAQPNGSKLPRHKMQSRHQPCGEGIHPRWLRSGPKPCHPNSSRYTACTGFATAAQPNGDESPHYKSSQHPCGEGACSRWAAQRPQTLPPQFFQIHRMHRLYDCCAAEREQAPSPHNAVPPSALW